MSRRGLLSFRAKATAASTDTRTTKAAAVRKILEMLVRTWSVSFVETDTMTIPTACSLA